MNEHQTFAGVVVGRVDDGKSFACDATGTVDDDGSLILVLSSYRGPEPNPRKIKRTVTLDPAETAAFLEMFAES